MRPTTVAVLVAISTGVLARNAGADPAADENLAQKLSNPIAAMISVPLQNNLDFQGGPAGGGTRYLLNFQPVIPFALTDDWNLISRTIVPTLYQNDMVAPGHQGGLGDIVESLWLSPKKPGPGPLIWGVGPAVLVPTATDDTLGSGKLGVGPTVIGLVQSNGWTMGALANHIWSVAGYSNRGPVSLTFLQPFVSYTTATRTTFSANTETTYNWESSQWTVPLNGLVSQLVKIGPLPVQFGAGPRFYVKGPMGTPDWGLRLAITVLLPK